MVHPLTLKVLRDDYGLDASDASSTSVFDIAEPFPDLVISVCDSARDSCPVFGRGVVQAHWGMPDPAAVDGSEAERVDAFRCAAKTLDVRFEKLVRLPWDRMSAAELRPRVEALASVGTT